MSKPRLFIFGACDLHDIVQNNVIHQNFEVVNPSILHHDNSSINVAEHGYPVHGTSILSLYTKPGSVAQRTMETYHLISNRERILFSPTYKEIMKFPWLDFYKKCAGPNDYLVLSFSAEIYTKFYSGNECFTLLPVMDHIFDSRNPFNWLLTQHFSKEEYLLPFDTKLSLESTFDVLADFAREIHTIFKDRIVVVKTHFSDLAISQDLSVKQLKVGPTNLLFYRQTKVATDPTDHKYAERLSEIIVTKFRHHYSSNVPLIQLNEPVFLDPNHEWGFSQFHIDAISRQKIAELLSAELMKHKLRNRYRSTYEN